MNKKNSSIIVLIVFIFNLFSTTVLASGEITLSKNETILTIDEAVKYGLVNSNTINQINIEKDLATTKNLNTYGLAEDLYFGGEDFTDALTKIRDADDLLSTSQTSINEATAAINNELAPEDISLSSTIKITKGTNIRNFLTSTLKAQIVAQVNATLLANKTAMGDDAYNAAKAIIDAGTAPVAIPISTTVTIPAGTNLTTFLSAKADEIISSVKKEIATNQAKVNSGLITLNASKDDFSKGTSEYYSGRKAAETVMSTKLNISELSKLTTTDLTYLMRESSDTINRITIYSADIYKQQFALLIQKNYYDTLKSKKISEVKESAVNRAKYQLDFSKEGYETGIKSKDEMLQARMFYTGSKLEYKNALKDYNNSLIDLKKTIGMPLNKTLKLVDVSANTKVEKPDLEKDKSSALEKRLEIIQAKDELALYTTLLSKVASAYEVPIGVTYPSSTRVSDDVYKEATQLQTKVTLKYNKAKEDVESSIIQSYETLNTTKEMLVETKELQEDAKENLEIAKLKYQQGFGIENSLLKSLNLESASGTILEVIAAEEKLSQVEQKVLEIENSYNLANMKYQFDIVNLKY